MSEPKKPKLMPTEENCKKCNGPLVDANYEYSCQAFHKYCQTCTTLLGNECNVQEEQAICSNKIQSRKRTYQWTDNEPCSMDMNGCTFRGTPEERKEHLKECAYKSQKLTCPFSTEEKKCGFSMDSAREHFESDHKESFIETNNYLYHKFENVFEYLMKPDEPNKWKDYCNVIYYKNQLFYLKISAVTASKKLHCFVEHLAKEENKIALDYRYEFMFSRFATPRLIGVGNRCGKSTFISFQDITSISLCDEKGNLHCEMYLVDGETYKKSAFGAGSS